MFGGLLRLELRRKLPEDIPELHRLAARWLAEHGQAADATRHLQAAGDWTDAARLLTDHALSLTLDGQAGTVAALLHSFPGRDGEEFPELALVHAITDLDQLRLDQADARLQVARSYAATAAPGRRYRLQLAVASLDLLLERLRGDFRSLFEQVHSLASPAVGQPNADVALGGDLRALALMNLGVTEAWSLRLAESEQHLLDGAALAQSLGRPYLEVACLAHLGFASTAHSFALARQRCEESDSAGGPARLGRRTGDRSRAGDAGRNADLDGRVRGRRAVAGPCQARHPVRGRARRPAPGAPDLRAPRGGTRLPPAGAGGARRRRTGAGAHGQ